MTILVLGVNHKTASVAVREKVAFSDEKRVDALQLIQRHKLANSAVILSTCNRTEVYLHNKHIAPQQAQNWTHNCIQWFADIHQLPLNELANCIYSQQNQQAALHLMHVACGLDSLILGEPQILGQVKQAYQISEQYYQQLAQPLSSELSRLFQKTFSTAKRVRTETNIGGSAVSVAYAACNLARQIFESLRQLNVLLVGAGETIELACRHLLRHGVKNIMIANRTLARAQQLVEKLDSTDNIQILSLSELQDGLNQADIVISSTGSPNILINQEMVKLAQKARCYLPMLLVDIAVPRDIEESVGQLESIYHYTVDDLQHIIQRNLTERQKAAEQAKSIIQQECEDFFEWLKVHQFSNLIRSYRDNAEDIRQQLLEKSLTALAQGEDAEAVLQELSHKLTNKLLHSPTQVMSSMVKTGNANGLALFSSTLKIEQK
ncbi:glutamyl-tRNA reductase [Pasteurella oralis]|uniref:glutamyl-tRNA reductase n=1 Tax=Pasteurella oralis TaxID=1071947 RepID=UPI000C7D034F|nr:glutamyl-tRNA reductase [Pasteurella oralis]